MTRKKVTITALILLAVCTAQVPAQTTAASTTVFDTTGFPQWVKDLRRWEIVAFGSIPFTMLTATFSMDMYRWSKANNFDFSEEGRRYAPWPLKSAGGVAMESSEMEKTLIIAASLSVAIAITDQIIVQVKRYKARKRAEALPAGTTIIDRRPLPEEAPAEQDDTQAGEPDA